MTPDADINIDVVGRRFAGLPYQVARDEIVAFSDATNDETEAFRLGNVAPPLFAAKPVLDVFTQALKQVTSRFVYLGEYDLKIVRQIEPEMVVIPVAEIVGVHQCSTGVTATVRAESHVNGRLINQQYFVGFVPNAKIARDRGNSAPTHSTCTEECTSQKPLGVHRYPLANDQTLRYAKASNDLAPYTVDEAAAREMGFPGLVVHGTCTIAFAGRAVIAELCPTAPERLARLAVRLSKPVFLFPDQQIETTLWCERSHRPGTSSVHFIARNNNQEIVLTNGVASLNEA